MKQKFIRCISIAVGILLLVVIIIIIRNLATKPMERELNTSNETSYRAYYLLNIDGMKGLGHSALLLQDSSGQAQIFSYNGMQYNLYECLMGKAGIGKMKQFSLEKEAVKQFLETGDLQAENYEECDNFDRAIYTDITQEEYETILENIQYYIEVGDEFERLYASDKLLLEEFLKQENLPRYQIYTHNCDTVARKLLSIASEELEEYNVNSKALTPAGNFKGMCKTLSEDWGILKLGEDSILENILSDY